MNMIFLSLIGLMISAPSYIPRATVEFANQPHYNFQVPPTDAKYQFKGYLKDEGLVYFESSLTTEGAENEPKQYVSLKDIYGGTDKAPPKRYPQDFDSLFVCEHHNGYQIQDSTWIPALPYHNRWIFPKITGKVSLYQGVPFSDEFAYMRFAPDTLTKFDQIAFEKRLFVNPESKSLMQSFTLGKSGSIMMLVLGGVLGAVGVLNSDQTVTDEFGQTKHEFNASPLIGVGAGLILTSWIPYVVVKDNYTAAIVKFNL